MRPIHGGYVSSSTGLRVSSMNVSEDMTGGGCASFMTRAMSVLLRDALGPYDATEADHQGAEAAEQNSGRARGRTETELGSSPGVRLAWC